MPRTLAHALYELGHRRTSWRPQGGGPGGVKHGTLDPNADPDDWKARYGNPDDHGLYGWLPENYTGAHATGDNNQVTPEIALAVMGHDSTTNHDLTDLNFIDGATALVVSRAIAAGLITHEPPPVVDPPAPPAEPPPVTPPPVDPPAPPPIEPEPDRYERVVIPDQVLDDCEVLLSLPAGAKLGAHRHERLLRIDALLQELADERLYKLV